MSTVLAAVLVVANISSLNVALPELSRELGASQSDVQWMVDIYAFFLASLLLPAGALGDRFGRKSMLLFGVAILGIANAATLFTEHFDFVEVDQAKIVIAFRALSGVGAAFIFPATLSTITQLVRAFALAHLVLVVSMTSQVAVTLVSTLVQTLLQ